MQFDYENREIEAALASADTMAKLDAGLVRLAELVPELMSPKIRGHKLFCPGLDALVPGLAGKLRLPDVPGVKSNDNCCIVATQFYWTGGHSRVAGDISRLVGGARITLVFTDLYRKRRYRDLVLGGPNPLFAYRSALNLSCGTLVEKVIELYMMLAAIKPTRIFLLANHMDMVATVGCWPFRSIVDFVHHADYAPALGATLPFSAHADLTHMCHEVCKAAGRQPVWAGMALPKVRSRAPEARRPGPLRIATCGSQHKYEQPAAHRWTDFVAALLMARDAEFLHIGEVDEAGQARIRAELAAAGVDPARYRFLGAVPSLGQTLVDEGVDAYLDSYPEGGARGNLEAMAAGIAPMAPIAPGLPRLLHFSSPIPAWVAVRAPEDAPSALARSLDLSAGIWDPPVQAAISREFAAFESYVAGPAVATTGR